MKRLFLLLICLGFSLAARAQTTTFPTQELNNNFLGINTFAGQTVLNGSTNVNLASYTIATLPAANTVPIGYIVSVTDAASIGSCTAGGGTGLSLCRSDGSTWGSLGGSGFASAVQFAIPQYATTTTFGTVCTPPATIGTFVVEYQNPTTAATAPKCLQIGIATRAVSGSTPSDTILASDTAGAIIDHDSAASSAVVFTVPTPTVLSNSSPVFLITNHSLQQDTVKATTWTIQSGSKAAVAGSTGIPLPPGSSARFSVDPVNATQWLVDTNISSASCTEVWGGSGSSYAMQSGDDAISNNTCYNDSGVIRTITAVKCRADNASNTTVLTPTFGAAGTGTAILTGTLTCGNSYAYSATGTLSNTAWTTGTGIDPGMSTVGNATSIAMIVEYIY